MREILFRGQTRRKGEKVRMGDGNPIESNWVYGGIFPNNDGGDFAIIYSQDPIEKHTVYADTVGQYTGLTDKNGLKIFEGDIVKAGGNLVVQWNEKFASWCLSKEGWMYNRYFGEAVNPEDCEVIGNIFDNPDLLTTSSADSGVL